MENNKLKISFNDKTGYVNTISIDGDSTRMNFIKNDKNMGELLLNVINENTWCFEPTTFQLISFSKKDNYAEAIYSLQGLRLTVTYRLIENRLSIQYLIKNNNPFPYYFKNADLKISIPFNDVFVGSEYCKTNACHMHVWTGLESSYVFAERMTTTNNCLGVVMTKGSISGYTQNIEPHWDSNGSFRGDIFLNLSSCHLLQNEELEFSYSIFSALDREDFLRQAKNFENYIDIRCENGYTVEIDNPIDFKAICKNPIRQAEAFIGKKKIRCDVRDNVLNISYKPTAVGETKINLRINGINTYVLFNVIPPIDKLIEKRIAFIVKNQQCLEKNSPLYGAYLLYDYKDESQYFNYLFPDHNACRERFGIPALIAKWLQAHPNEKFRKSLDLFIEFLFRECVDANTGFVSNSISLSPDRPRLYNIPWVMNVLVELYKLTKKESYVDILIKVIRFYYTSQNGEGLKFYPDGCIFSESFDLIKRLNKRDEAKDIFAYFKEHTQNIIDIGLNYPSHEVCYEQAIVAPAVTLLLDRYRVFEDESTLSKIDDHLFSLKRFDGFQPDFHLNKIAIRYWDAFWFGDSHTYGDTLPQYWSAYSGIAFAYYGILTNDKDALNYARQNALNCLSLFDKNGKGYSAYIYPDILNGADGKYYDNFSNDQDLGLYFILKIFDFYNNN